MTMDAVMRRWEKDYNPRRYSRPWIARVLDWAVGMAPNLEWGRFQGGSGGPGLLEVHAGSGDIVRWGQKDRRGKNTVSQRGIASA